MIVTPEHQIHHLLLPEHFVRKGEIGTRIHSHHFRWISHHVGQTPHPSLSSDFDEVVRIVFPLGVLVPNLLQTVN